MPRTLIGLVILATSWCCLARSALAADGAAAPAPVVLRAEPDRLCGASAVVGGRDGAAWVVDDQIDDALLGFTREDGTLTATKARNVDLSAVPAAERPHDVEAAAVVVHSLVLAGSHARNDDCEVRPDQERVLIADFDAAGAAVRSPRVFDDADVMARVRAGDEDTCLTALFSRLGRANDASRALCRAIVAAERAASKDACATFAIAGAATMVQEERQRLWLGLQAPLVDGKAALVRLATLNDFSFDMTVLVDLGGKGIRDLAERRGSILAIAGPARHVDVPLALFQLVPKTDAAFVPHLVRSDLTPSSAGLLATDAGLIVVVDGEAGAAGAPCRTPARQYPLPDPTTPR